MAFIVLRLSELEKTSNVRPRCCPDCGSQILQRWGQVSKNIQDTQRQTTEFYRYRCSECECTFRYYPEGVNSSNQTFRIRDLAAVIQLLGLSCRDVVGVFNRLGIRLSRMTVWRSKQELIARLNGQGNIYCVPGYSLDKDYMQGISEKLGVVVAIDLGRGKLEVIGTLDEHNPRVVKSWLEPIVKESGIELSLRRNRKLNPIGISNP